MVHCASIPKLLLKSMHNDRMVSTASLRRYLRRDVAKDERGCGRVLIE